MKKTILGIVIFMLLLGLSYAQEQVSARVHEYGWTVLRDGGKAGLYTTADTLSFPIKHYRGSVVYWADFDTTGGGSSQSDSCVSLYLELYNETAGGWGKYYSSSESTLLDTIDRALCNVDEDDIDIYVPLAQFNTEQWAWADSARIIEVIGTSDKLGGSRYVGGQ